MGFVELLAVLVAAALAWAALRSALPERAERLAARRVRVTQPAPLGGAARRDGEGGTRLFGYGVRATGPTLTGHRHDGPFTVLAISTTGLSPASDRIIELAMVRLTADGRVTHRWSSVLDPAGQPLGLTAVNGLTTRDTAGARTFTDAVGPFMTLAGGAVVVAHNAEFAEAFLLHEFLRAGLLAPSVPALSATRLAQVTVATPNHRLGTVAHHLGVRHGPDGSATAEAAALADIFPPLLRRHAGTLVYPVPPLPPLPLDRVPPGRLRRGPVPGRHADPWLDELMRAVPISALEVHDPRAAAYVEMLTTLLARGHIVTAEARELSGLAARAGFSPAAIRSILERFCELLRQAAFEATPRLGPAHVRHLRAVATSLGLSTYFDDLIPPRTQVAPEPGSGSFSRPVRKPLPPAPPRLAPRCGHCLAIGHWTPACPRLGRRDAGRVTPIRPITPI